MQFQSESPKRLREQAEALLQGKPANRAGPPSEDLPTLVQKLLVYQTALEIQSDELQRVKEELTRAQQSLAELSNQRTVLESIINTAQSIILVLDNQGRIAHVNPFFEELTGWKSEEVQGRDWFETFLPEQDRETIRQLFRRAHGGKATRGNVNPILTKAGEERFIEWHDSRLTKPDGEMIGLVSIGQDVTDRRSAEIARCESEQRLQLAQQAAQIGVWEWDIEQGAISWDALQFKICGIDPGEDVSLETLWDIVHPEDKARLKDVFDEAVRDEAPYNTEFRIVRPDGTIRWLAARGSVIGCRCDTGLQMIGVNFDITQRKEVEMALRDREQRLGAILNTAADAIITIDQHGIITNANPATERIFGYTQEELLGQNVKMLMPPPFCDEHDQFIASYLRTRQSEVIGTGREVVGRRKDGSIFPMDLAMSEIRQLGLFTSVLRDISDRRELEKQVLEIAAEEDRRIGSELHDSIQQQLTGLGLFAVTISEGLNKRSAPEAQMAARLAEGIQQATEQVHLLSHGLVAVEVEEEGLRAALTELTRRVCEQFAIQCEFRCQENIKVDDNFLATHLYRIAQEAITNAVKHGQAKRIGILLGEVSGRLTIQISDNGVGVRDEPADAQGMGVRIMKYRASLIGATLSITRGEPTGTLVSCAVLPKTVLT